MGIKSIISDIITGFEVLGMTALSAVMLVVGLLNDQKALGEVLSSKKKK